VVQKKVFRFAAMIGLFATVQLEHIQEGVRHGSKEKAAEGKTDVLARSSRRYHVALISRLVRD
jgi:hypothetical protein